MKLNEDTVEILKNFSNINNSIVIEQGSTIKTISENKTVMAVAHVADDFPVSFGIDSLKKFLSVLSLFETPELEITEKVIYVRDGSKEVRYTCAERSMILTPTKTIQMPPIQVSIKLAHEQLASATKACAVLKLPEMAFIGRNGKIYLAAVTSADPTGDEYTVEIADTDKNFKAFIKTPNLNLLPNNYVVDIAKGVFNFRSEHVEYYIAAESNSKFED